MTEKATAALLLSRSRNTEAAMPAIEEFFRALALRLRSRLVNRASGEFDVRLVGVDVKPLGQLIKDRDYRAAAVYGLIRVDTPRLPGLVVVQRVLLARLIGAMLGDEEGSEHEGAEVRPLSPVETTIAKRLIEDVLHELGPAWPTFPVPTIELDGMPGTARVVDEMSRPESAFVATLDFGPPEEPFGLMAVAAPIQAFRTLGTSPNDLNDDTDNERTYSMDRVMPMEVGLVAEMARVKLPVGKLRSLAVGDVIPLGRSRKAVIRVNERVVIEGEPGFTNGQRSIKVTEKLD